jgi:signal transduction histidine kinase
MDSRPSSASRSLNIVLLEDDDSDAALVLRELRRAGVGFVVARAATRAEFLAGLKAAPDLVLSDYSLPAFDGMSALALAQQLCPDVPFIFVSGALGEDRAIELLKMGATDFVLKDRLARLGPAVARALGEAEERRRRRAAEQRVQEQTAQLLEANALLQQQVRETRRHAERAEVWAHTAEDRGRQLQMLSRRLVQLQEEERRSLSRELHDDTGQLLTALKLGLSVLEREAGDEAAVRSRISGLKQTADAIADSLHQLAVSLRPFSLDRYGLAPALEGLLADFARRTGLEVEFTPDLGTGRLGSDTETALYRIVQETLTNVLRHAQASHVVVRVGRQNGVVRLQVEDDGRGFDVAEALARGRLGLLGMRERAEMLGGSLEVDSRPGEGTTVAITVPLDPPARDLL